MGGSCPRLVPGLEHNPFREFNDLPQPLRLTDVWLLLSSVKVLSGALVRLTTCKRLANNSLPKVSLVTLLGATYTYDIFYQHLS